MICTAPGLLFWDEHYGDLAMRACKKDFFQVPPYLQLLGPNQALSVTAALKCQVSYRRLEAQLVPRFSVLLGFSLFASGRSISWLRKSVRF